MKRKAFEEYVSRSLDGELNEEESRLLKSALLESASLRQLKRDLERIHDIAGEACPPGPSSPARALQAEIDRIYGASSPGRHGFRLLNRWVWAAAALFLCLIGWWRYQPSMVEDPWQASLAQIQQNVFESRYQYHQAVQKMEDTAIQRLGSLPPGLALDFADDLKTISRAIASTERIVDDYPDNHLAYAALSRAYHAKVSLLDKILLI